jgi:hypothetical protein
MILLPPSEYHKVLEPLSKVPITTLYYRAVVEKRNVQGWVYVDNIEDPKVFYITHLCGMSLIFGEINRYPNIFMSSEWLLSYPNIDNPNNFFRGVYSKIYKYTRVHYKFNPAKYKYKKNGKLKIVRVDKKIYQKLRGQVHPKFYWDNMSDFLNIGVAFSVMYDDEPVSTAFATSIIDNVIDIGVDTVPRYRERGFGTAAANAMVEFCLENNCEPLWGTFSYNFAGMRVAEKLGFEIVEHLPCYGLNLNVPLTNK